MISKKERIYFDRIPKYKGDNKKSNSTCEKMSFEIQEITYSFLFIPIFKTSTILHYRPYRP